MGPTVLTRKETHPLSHFIENVLMARWMSLNMETFTLRVGCRMTSGLADLVVACFLENVLMARWMTLKMKMFPLKDQRRMTAGLADLVVTCFYDNEIEDGAGTELENNLLTQSFERYALNLNPGITHPEDRRPCCYLLL